MELEVIRIALAVSMLGIACISDIRKREISDVIWMAFGTIAVILIPFSQDITEDLIKTGIALIVAPIVIIIWRFGLFGGADAFALIVLAGLAPSVTLSNNTVTPFTTLTNAVLLSIIPMIVNLSRNSILLARGHDIFQGFNETKSKRILAMIVGYRAKNPKFGFSLEQHQGNNKKLSLALQHAEYTEFCNTKDTWITPGIPYMIFIVAGFVIQLFYGDILLRFWT